MAGYGGGNQDECKMCGSPPWESCRQISTSKQCLREQIQTARTLLTSEMRERQLEQPLEVHESTPDDAFTHQLAHSGRVRRYHTWAVHSQQTVGEHCWQLARVYTAIFGRPEADVAHYIAHHDSAELVVGDPPFPVKARNPILKAAYDSLELIALQELGVGLPELSPRERTRVKLCDLVEMHEFGLLEVEMGNRHAREVVDNTRAAINKIIGAGVPVGSPEAEDNTRVSQYLAGVARHHNRVMSR